MSTLKHLVLLAALCLTLKFTSANLRTTIDKELHKPHERNNGGEEIYVNTKSFRNNNGNGNLTQMQCYWENKTKNCTVRNPDGAVCHLPTMHTHHHEIFQHYLEVHPFGPTRAIVLWGVYGPNSTLYYDIVDFTTCDSVRRSFMNAVVDKAKFYLHTDLVHSMFSLYVLPHENSFELITTDGEWKKFTKFEIDAQGNILSKIEPWVTAEDRSFLFPIVKDSKSNYIMFNDTIRAFVLMPDGTKKILGEVKNEWPTDNYVDISITHDRISTAIRTHDTIKVDQYDNDYNHKSSVTVKLDKLWSLLGVTNTADGGALIAYFGCHKNKCRENGERKGRQEYLDLPIQVVKVDSEGKISGRIETLGDDDYCPKTVVPQVYENEKNDYCVAYVCGEFRKANAFVEDPFYTKGQTINYKEKCFNNEDFKPYEP